MYRQNLYVINEKGSEKGLIIQFIYKRSNHMVGIIKKYLQVESWITPEPIRILLKKKDYLISA